MLFVLSKLAWPLLDPVNLTALLLVFGAVLLWTRWLKLGRILVAGAALFILLAGLLPAGTWLLVMLERRFPQVDPPAHVDGIIALGGAVNTELSERYGRPALNESAERLAALAELRRRYPNAVAVYAGGGAPFDAPFKESDAAAQALAQMGADPSRILFERKSRNTRENALFARDLVKPAPGQVWLLVTSAYHMPRAVAVFRALDWPVVPYPVDQRTTGRFELDLGLNVRRPARGHESRRQGGGRLVCLPAIRLDQGGLSRAA
jgi:uncharacterized SAM-binding protein YcdF (DUF218 family)